MKPKITMIFEDGLTIVKCTLCGTEDQFKTFDDTDNFKQKTLAKDWELGMEQSMTCLTCDRTTPFYNWQTQNYYY
ncbi:hypothetical protein ACG94X_07250 [Acinetobacter sp. ULE_I010]|uniref:hypothetical protein n=1 Tax=Acinetobacter sp. ULE_I010 TaxID=3373065 RepID=UPI003AF4EBD9